MGHVAWVAGKEIKADQGSGDLDLQRIQSKRAQLGGKAPALTAQADEPLN